MRRNHPHSDQLPEEQKGGATPSQINSLGSIQEEPPPLKSTLWWSQPLRSTPWEHNGGATLSEQLLGEHTGGATSFQINSLGSISWFPSWCRELIWIAHFPPIAIIRHSNSRFYDFTAKTFWAKCK